MVRSVLDLSLAELFKVRRPSLGNNIHVGLYRIVKHVAFMQALGNKADKAAFDAGKVIGKGLGAKNANELIGMLEELKVGKIKVAEQTDEKIVVRVWECISCSGLPGIGKMPCFFEGGIIGGALESILKKKVKVRQTKSIGGFGDPYCEFVVTF
jgi:predicted hydrocarbon binding protein